MKVLEPTRHDIRNEVEKRRKASNRLRSVNCTTSREAANDNLFTTVARKQHKARRLACRVVAECAKQTMAAHIRASNRVNGLHDEEFSINCGTRREFIDSTRVIPGTAGGGNKMACQLFLEIVQRISKLTRSDSVADYCQFISERGQALMKISLR